MVKKSRVILNGTLKQEFQKDLELFKHFLLMVNKSGPIRNVELMWKEENEELEPSKDRYKSRVGTEDALVELQPAGSIPGKRNSPSSLFCDLVHGYGTHEEGTCAKSDVPAKRRCEQTGCSQVYSCHVGLTDIAVPVICDEEYLGTLFSGQVLTHAPTPEGFRFVRENLAGQSHINMKSLETAYYRVPVVDQTQVAEMVRVLELFARYLVNSWKRLKIMGDYQRTHDRELALNRKELASILLSGELGDGQELNAFARRSGMQCLPNRVMVMQIAQMGENSEKPQKLSERMTLNRMSHLVEDNCQNWANTLSMMVRPGEVCIFTSHESRNAAHERISLQEMAQSMLNSIREQAGVTARIGISAAHRQPVELMHAYLEACAALDSDSVSITFSRSGKQSEAPHGDIRAVGEGLATRKRYEGGDARISGTCRTVRSLARKYPEIASTADLGNRTHGVGSDRVGYGPRTDYSRERTSIIGSPERAKPVRGVRGVPALCGDAGAADRVNFQPAGTEDRERDSWLC